MCKSGTLIGILVFMTLSAGRAPAFAQAQKYDLLIRGGRIIDPKNGIDAQRDVAV